MAKSPMVYASVPPELLKAARDASGLHDATDSILVRRGLAALAGLNPEVAYVKRGRPYGVRETRPRGVNKTGPEHVGAMELKPNSNGGENVI